MTQSLVDIVIHIVFSTKERKPWINAEIPYDENTCGIEAFMSAFQASVIGVHYPGLTAWAMKYWPFRPSVKLRKLYPTI